MSDDHSFACPPGEHLHRFSSQYRYAASFPRMWEVEGEKCLHQQRRQGRITLVCVRLKDHQTKWRTPHLHDVPPELQA